MLFNTASKFITQEGIQTKTFLLLVCTMVYCALSFLERERPKFHSLFIIGLLQNMCILGPNAFCILEAGCCFFFQ